MRCNAKSFPILSSLGFLMCCTVFFVHEAYYSWYQCGSTQDDLRPYVQSAFFLITPLCFTLAMMDSWLGKRLGLDFDSNQRTPSCCCRYECGLPSFLVGFSCCWFLFCAAWMTCEPKKAVRAGIGGAAICVVGFGLSFYLRGFCSCRRKKVGQDKDDDKANTLPNRQTVESDPESENDMERPESSCYFSTVEPSICYSKDEEPAAPFFFSTVEPPALPIICHSTVGKEPTTI